jgi:hypothetical protein
MSSTELDFFTFLQLPSDIEDMHDEDTALELKMIEPLAGVPPEIKPIMMSCRQVARPILE